MSLLLRLESLPDKSLKIAKILCQERKSGAKLIRERSGKSRFRTFLSIGGTSPEKVSSRVFNTLMNFSLLERTFYDAPLGPLHSIEHYVPTDELIEYIKVRTSKAYPKALRAAKAEQDREADERWLADNPGAAEHLEHTKKDVAEMRSEERENREIERRAEKERRASKKKRKRRKGPKTKAWHRKYDQEIVRLYVEERKPVSQIIKEIPCSKTTAFRVLKKHGAMEKVKKLGPVYAPSADSDSKKVRMKRSTSRGSYNIDEYEREVARMSKHG